MKKYSAEFSVGVFVLVGLICLGYLTIKLGKMELFSDNAYTLHATFDSITGLRTGGEVQIAGVTIGKVAKINLDTHDNTRAEVELRINNGVKLTSDAIAAIKTSGLIGDKYIGISQGGSQKYLANNDEIEDTQSAIDIEALISKYVFGGVQ